MNKLIVLGANADIGFNIASMYLDEGFEVIGTYRKENDNSKKLEDRKNIELIRCNLLDKKANQDFLSQIKERNFLWTNFFSSIGSSEPIGNFFDLDFEDWERSININFTRQLELIHGLYVLNQSIGSRDSWHTSLVHHFDCIGLIAH